jgi:type VI secretion system FHA domain protein
MSITVKIMRRAAGGRSSIYATRDLDVLPVSIGRDATCTFVLEDPNKHISRFHVEIEEEGGTYWMSVVSKVNPVLVKGRRYGPGTRLTLNSGDVFDIAEYEVQLLLPEARPDPVPRAAMAPPSPAFSSTTQMPVTRTGSADDAERLFNESTFFGGDPAVQKLIPQEEPRAEETFIPVKAKPAPPPAPAPRTAADAPAALLQAFFDGAGLPAKELSAAQGEQMLRESGAILRASVEGIMMLLLARAEMRKEFQAEERTMVAARDNNPLKLMSDPHEAMDFLFDPAERTEGFLDPAQAVSDACEDLRSHELALMAGMRAAIFGALRRFDPQAIERAFDKNSKGFSLASRKSRLWDLFIEQQDKVSREVQEDFNKVFGRDFMAAYQSQLRRMKGGK